MHQIAELLFLLSDSHSFNTTCNQPASCRMPTSSHVPKNINKYTSETSYSALYRLHISNGFILACKGSNNLYVIFDFSIPNSCNCLSSSGRQSITKVWRNTYGRAYPKATSDLRRCSSYSGRQRLRMHTPM